MKSVRLVGEERELDRGDAAAAARLLPVLGRVRDLARRRARARPARTGSTRRGRRRRRACGSQSHRIARPHARRAFHRMMDAVDDPAVRDVLRRARGEVLGLLRRRLGRDRADDAFQETFLRALRAYDRLEHGEHLRAWVLTIAARVAIDVHRRAGEPTDELPELPHQDGAAGLRGARRPHGRLPPEGARGRRAPLRLRPRPTTQIAAALGSSPDAARQAASSGVRRLRKEDAHDRSPRARPPLPRGRRRAGLLDAAYDVVDSADRAAARRGDRPRARCASRSTPSPSASSRSSPGSPARACCARPRARRRRPPRARRVLRRPAPDLRPRSSTSAGMAPFTRRACSTSSRASRTAQTATYGELAARAGQPAGRARGRDGDEPQPDPDRASVPPHRRRLRQPVGYGGGLERKGAPPARGRDAVNSLTPLRGRRAPRARRAGRDASPCGAPDASR